MNANSKVQSRPIQNEELLMQDAIYLILPTEQVAVTLGKAFYSTPSIETEGFIHACSETQINYVLARFYKDQGPLSLLKVDPNLIKPEVKYEGATNNPELGLFPHIYGQLNTDAIVEVTEI
ncbi:DUF952 domain-containing protein [Pseudoalteromonas phenolica O-BC30]|uniref:DUF952 domain-containing protein n=2 Tax=Pseudoalteromonas phenolica TaxID=161398 RepID=A0A0S2K6Y4_9GAMM|nr:hypothetical protein PP2015_3503 [Pseudoalteromonas phenolica]RXE96122.1 DUF952 domain-containing protein [Pseudoalteromonas phenolica O-BC30]